jgi:hypothetical protein
MPYGTTSSHLQLNCLAGMLNLTTLELISVMAGIPDKFPTWVQIMPHMVTGFIIATYQAQQEGRAHPSFS